MRVLVLTLVVLINKCAVGLDNQCECALTQLPALNVLVRVGILVMDLITLARQSQLNMPFLL